MGDLYLNIVESKNRDNGGFDRQSVILFADDLQEFLKGFDESLRVLEKAVREKRHPGGSSQRSGSASEGRKERRPAGSFAASTKRDEKPGSGERGRKSGFTGERKSGFTGERKGRFASGQRRSEGSRPARTERSRQDSSGGKSFRSRDGERTRERGGERKPRDSKRVVVRKRD